MAFYKCDKKQNGGGLKIGDVSNFNAVADSSIQKVTLTWTDPDDLVIQGTVQAKWAGTMIVRKAFSEPTSTGDGTLVANSTVKNQYSSVGLEDEDVYLGTTYYYRAFPYTTDGVTTVGSSVSVETAAAHIFGVEWDGTASSSWTRTDGATEFVDPNPYYVGMESTPSSPFDDIMPWSGMVKVEDNEAGTLVAIPKYYFKWQQNGARLKLQISSEPEDGFLVSPAHADRGDGKGERDVVYIGAFPCETDTYKSTNNFSSSSRQGSKTKAEFRTAIHNLGSTIWQQDFAMWWTIRMLYLVEYADWNSQAKIGHGCVGNRITGMNLPYHSGTDESDGRDVSDRSAVMYRNIAHLWSEGMEFIDGFYTAGTRDYPSYETRFYCIKNPALFSDDSNGTLIREIIREDVRIPYVPESFWHIPSSTGFEYALTPQKYTADGSEEIDNGWTEYICDEYEADAVGSNGTYMLLSGGQFPYPGTLEAGRRYGLFYFNLNMLPNFTMSNLGSRLMKLP